jgi:GNAT superfamily N-acetyltransferase
MSTRVFVDARWHLSFVHMSDELTEAVLFRLTSEAFLTYLGHADSFEFTLQAGCASALSGVPVADLNYVVAGPGASDGRRFADVCEPLVSRGLPFLAVVFLEAASHVEQPATRLGLEHVVDFPFMVRDDAPIEPQGNEMVSVRLAVGPEGADANVRVLSSAFSMPEEASRAALPPALLEAPNLDVFLAWMDDRVVGTVTLIHQGDATGVWSMGTDPALQRSGIGRRLLSTAIAEARLQGAKRFYLGATPAGNPLYESLGFTTRTVTKVWASGETHQA